MDTTGTPIPEMNIETLQRRLHEADDAGEKLHLLIHLSNKFLHVDMDRALVYARDALRLAKAERNTVWTAYSLIRIGMYHTAKTEYLRALYYFDKANAMLETVPDVPEARAQLYSYIAMVHGMQSNYVKAMEWAGRDLDLSREIGPSRSLVRALGNMGLIHANVRDLPRALAHMEEGLTIGQLIDDQAGMGPILGNLGTIYLELNDLDRAGECYSRCLEIARRREERMSEISMLTNLGTIHMMRNEWDQALAYHNDALDLVVPLGMKQYLAKTLGNIGKTYQAKGDLQDAVGYIEQAIDLYGQAGNMQAAAMERVAAARAHTDLGDLEIARRHIDGVLDSLATLDDRTLLHDAYGVLAAIHEKQGDHQQSLACYKLSADAAEHHQREQAQRALAMMEARAEIERAWRERELYRNRSDELAEEMERRTQALAIAMLQLARNSEHGARLEERVRSYTGRAGSEVDDLVKTLLVEIRQSRSDGGQWEAFEQQLRRLHPEFLTTMSALCPLLTPTELKICSLIRINLSTKDIADIFCTSIRTIDNHRWHIRAKLRLTRDINLTTFLTAIR